MYFSHGPLHFLEKASIRYVFTSHTNYYKFSSTINTISKYTGIIKLHGTYAIVQNFTTLHPFNPTRCPVQQEVRQIRRSSRSPFLHYSSNFLANSRDQYSQTNDKSMFGLTSSASGHKWTMAVTTLAIYLSLIFSSSPTLLTRGYRDVLSCT
jgi:hypothetical protein